MPILEEKRGLAEWLIDSRRESKFPEAIIENVILSHSNFFFVCKRKIWIIIRIIEKYIQSSFQMKKDFPIKIRL